MPVNTPTKNWKLLCIGEQKRIDNSAVACNRVLWELNNLSVLQVNELNVFEFELKVINEKCHSFLVEVEVLSLFSYLSCSCVVAGLTTPSSVRYRKKPYQIWRTEWRRRKKRIHETKWQYCLFVVQFLLWHGTGYVSRFDNKYHWRWVNYVCTSCFAYTDCVKHK